MGWIGAVRTERECTLRVCACGGDGKREPNTVARLRPSSAAAAAAVRDWSAIIVYDI